MSQYRCSRHDWYICLSPSPSSPFHSLCWSSVGKELSKERQRCVTMEGRERERRKKQLKDKSRGSRWNSGASDLAPGMLYRRRRRRLGWIYRERSRQIGWRTLLSVAGSLTAGRPAQPSISFSLSISSRLRLLILLPVQTVDQKPAIAGSSLMPTGCGSVDWRIADRGRKESDGGNL